VEETAAAGGGQIGFTQPGSLSYPSAKGSRDATFLFYFDFHQPLYYDVSLPKKGKYRADLIDPWAMTVTPVPGQFSGRSRLKLTDAMHGSTVHACVTGRANLRRFVAVAKFRYR